MKEMKLLLLLFLTPFFTLAQVSENFSDGDFTNNPAWTGNTSDWVVTNGQLQSNNTVASSTFYLSTANTLATTVQWEFYTRLNFNTSSANYVDVFLISNNADLTSNSNNGYFVRIGNTDDEISLFRKDGGTVTKIIDGVNGTTNKSDNVLKIKVVRDAANNFILFRDAGATGNYVIEGSVIDATYTTSTHFGFLVRQSTSSFFQRHYFDDIVIQTYVPDVKAPTLQSVTATSPNTIDVLFSETLDAASAQTITNYVVNNSIGSPQTATIDASNNALVHLTFANNFASGTTNTITINGVKDLAGNAITNGSSTFSFYIPQRFDVLITEIMADPSPQVSLPNAEYIELKNTTNKPINIAGWRIATPTSTSGAFPNYIIPVDGYVIISSTTNAPLFTTYGNVIGVTSFPALDNNGTTLSLLSKEGKNIHAVNYNIDWYQNTTKDDGGWSFEMIDPKNPCSGMSNWIASNDARGGTPGTINSVNGNNTDATAPQLLRAYTTNTNTVILVFNEPLDSSSAATLSNYSINNGITISSVQAISPLFNTVQLNLSNALQTGTIYTITANNIKDCKGNVIGSINNAKIGTTEDAAAKDIVVNEILFNPRPNGNDYVELYNRSNKTIDASTLFITNRTSAGALGTLRRLTTNPFYIFPGDYVVITSDAASLQLQYLVKNAAAVIEISTMPSFPDEEGTVVVINAQNIIIDEVAYDKDWHLALLDDEEGVALERIDPDGESQNKNNWQSAASTAGYGTPGYVNSQFNLKDNIKAAITISPKIFSPDGDGFDDIATIEYAVTQGGYIANVTIFDARGRPVRRLIKNATLGYKGSWTWDGLNDNNQKLLVGTYVFFTEIFNLQGKKERFKTTVVLARKIN